MASTKCWRIVRLIFQDRKAIIAGAIASNSGCRKPREDSVMQGNCPLPNSVVLEIASDIGCNQ